MFSRNLFFLVFAQLLSATGSIVVVTLGAIIGTRLAANPSYATLPMSLMVVAVAATSVPASLLMQRIGRRAGFVLASMTASLSVLMAWQSIRLQSFWLFAAAMVVFGINMAFAQQFRYAAAESVSAAYTGRAISFVLFGAIGGAFLGPELIKHFGDVADVPYAGTMLALCGLYLLQAVLVGQLRLPQAKPGDHAIRGGRPLGEIVRQPVFITAVLGGTVGYGLMTLVMTATPLSMHVGNGHSMAATSDVIRAHVIAMYLPSIASGFLIERIGVRLLMGTGVVLLAATSLIGLQGQAVLHYWWALVMLGVGWNFLYVGGTTMLTYAYRPEERFRAQAVNEFCVFGASASASLLAGVVIHQFGWNVLMLVPLPILALMLVLLGGVRRKRVAPVQGRP